MFRRRTPELAVNSYILGDVPSLMQGASVYSFKEGMITLSNALERALSAHPNVELGKSDAVVAVERSSDNDITVRSP